jgi:hypothetical protein
MRLASLAFPFAAFALAAATSGCVTQEYVSGTTSYTSTPAAATSTGALPATALLCSTERYTNEYVLQLGPACRVRLLNVGGPRRSGALASILGDRCDVAGSDGLLSLDVTSTTAQLDYTTLDLTIGGTSRNDGRYVTYRFTGTRGAPAPNEACEAVTADLKPRPRYASRD